MKRVFGTRSGAVGSSKPQPTTLVDATSNLDTRGNTLDTKIDQLDGQLAKLRDQISRSRPGPSQEGLKRRALQILKQKRLYEGQREQVYAQQFNLDQVAFTAESVKDTVTTVQALKNAKKDLTKQMKAKEFNVDKIDKLQDEMADLVDRQREIQDTLGMSYDVPEIDEAELMDELDALDFEMAMDKSTVDAQGRPSYLQPEPEQALPTAPTAAQPAQPAQPAQTNEEENVQLDAYGLPAAPRH